jgi:hypothetical protein
MNRQIGVSKNRQSDSYWYERGEKSSNYLMAAAVEQRTSEHQQEQRTMSSMKLFTQILKAFNSLEALVIFQRVANSGINGIDKTSLGRSALRLITRKQFYMRMAALKQAGLISRTSGKYRLTSLGLVVRSSLNILDKGIMFKWALSMLDSAKQQQNLEPQIKDILIDKMVTDETIRKILIIEQGEAEGPAVICGE